MRPEIWNCKLEFSSHLRNEVYFVMEEFAAKEMEKNPEILAKEIRQKMKVLEIKETKNSN
jgi:hypothetical protein